MIFISAINFLKNKPAGTFVIRNSNSFPGAFGLALKVAHLPPNVHAKGSKSNHLLALSSNGCSM